MEDGRAVPAVPTFSSLAIFSLTFAVLAWTVLPVMGIAMIGFNMFNILAVPLSGSVIASLCAWIAQRQIRRSGGALRGEGLAKTARIMAYAQYALFGLLFLFVLLQIPFMGPHVYHYQPPGSR